ncbi:MAG: VanZ family protein [Lamprobacter sp.]|uniref:VanZ family protein n=1 Tax=Lamprobacter sp. TaxID=3100796 RepID=UPI002B25C41C|nr:VanZ family protein [Lamprobacter sp.]MEA3641429.1 VanZ family protein [Lamprobacter sp.]
MRLLQSIPFRVAVSLCLTAAVILLSLLPGYPAEDDAKLLLIVASVPSVLQNTMHLVLYALLALCWAAAFEPGQRPILWAAALVTALGILLESAQLLVPGRYASLWDIGLNSAGVLIGSLAAGSLARRYPLTSSVSDT